MYAFSRNGLAVLEGLRGQTALFAFDFDGTLAPIVADSRRAKLSAGTRALLARLARTAPVAAVSGRPVGDLRARVPIDLRAFAGDHGAEIFPAKLRRDGSLASAKKVIRHWEEMLGQSLPRVPGVWLERKELSLCVHFRQARRRADAKRGVLRAVAALDPPARILPGKCVVNLLNPRLPHKGDAVLAIMKATGARAAMYVGDDSNDEDVFALGDPRICTIRVGRRKDSRAALYLKRQSEIDRLLRFLLSLPGPPRYRGGR